MKISKRVVTEILADWRGQASSMCELKSLWVLCQGNTLVFNPDCKAFCARENPPSIAFSGRINCLVALLKELRRQF